MQSKVMNRAAAILGLVSGAAMLAQAPMAAAQNYDNQGDYSDPAPPQGSYAEPPPGYEQNGSSYDDRAQDYDRDYADRYSSWAAQNCVNERNNGAAAGAIIGGVLGAVVGSNAAGRHDRTGGAIVGGALGATAGASIGASSGSGSCPPGYNIRHGAPAFYYGGGTYYAGPSWYNPWVFAGGRYVYHPYRYWYWNHKNYWKPGYRAKPWKNRHRRW